MALHVRAGGARSDLSRGPARRLAPCGCHRACALIGRRAERLPALRSAPTSVPSSALRAPKAPDERDNRRAASAPAHQMTPPVGVGSASPAVAHLLRSPLPAA